MIKEVIIAIEGVNLPGVISMPEEAKSWIIFAHGAGSSRFSPRNTFVANQLNNEGHATLLLDLLTQEEDLIYDNRFDINLLAKRLLDTAHWLVKTSDNKNQLPIGLFGASTGAAAALMMAADPRSYDLPIMAIVSRGGRPDLARADNLWKITIPTLLIVGGLDHQVIDVNRMAQAHLQNSELKIVNGATHLFEESGKLDEVVELTLDWFGNHLVAPGEKRDRPDAFGSRSM